MGVKKVIGILYFVYFELLKGRLIIVHLKLSTTPHYINKKSKNLKPQTPRASGAFKAGEWINFDFSKNIL